MVLVTAAALVLGAVLIGFALPKAEAEDGELLTPPYIYAAGVIDGDALGAAAAPVVMELYADFQCPACRMFVTQQLHRLVDEFVAPGTLRIEARDIAFLGRGANDESLALATGASCAAEQGRYWQYHDLVFWNQGRENRGDHSDRFIERVGAAAGVEPAAFATCRGRPEVAGAVTSLTKQSLAAGIQQTPTLVINGQKVVGVPNYDQLAALIRQLAAPGSPSPSGSPEATGQVSPS
jgi:protein-disulfide isomerase